MIKLVVANPTDPPDPPDPPLDIVKDSLICWLDGRDGKDKETIWLDRSGKNNNAILNGFSFDSTSGWLGKGLKFDGVKDYCVIEKNEDMQNAITGKTLEFSYTKATEYQNVCGILGYTSSRGEPTRFGILKDPNNGYGVLVGNSGLMIGGIPTPTLNEVHIETVVMDGNRLAFYRDNVKLEDVQMEISLETILDIFRIGAYGDSEGVGSKYFNDIVIHSVKIYNKPLSDIEINKNFEYEKSIIR